jgi:hypothetical protein
VVRFWLKRQYIFAVFKGVTPIDPIVKRIHARSSGRVNIGGSWPSVVFSFQ